MKDNHWKNQEEIKCAVCGVKRKDHCGIRSGGHTIWKRRGSASATLCRKWVLHYYRCNKYGGWCPEFSSCFALKTAENEDYGCHECIYIEAVKE